MGVLVFLVLLCWLIGLTDFPVIHSVDKNSPVKTTDLTRISLAVSDTGAVSMEQKKAEVGIVDGMTQEEVSQKLLEWYQTHKTPDNRKLSKVEKALMSEFDKCRPSRIRKGIQNADYIFRTSGGRKYQCCRSG